MYAKLSSFNSILLPPHGSAAFSPVRLNLLSQQMECVRKGPLSPLHRSRQEHGSEWLRTDFPTAEAVDGRGRAGRLWSNSNLKEPPGISLGALLYTMKFILLRVLANYRQPIGLSSLFSGIFLPLEPDPLCSLSIWNMLY